MRTFMWIFVVNIIAFSIAHPINNELLDRNEASIKDSSPPMEFPRNDGNFLLVDTNATLLHELSGTDDKLAAEESESEKDGPLAAHDIVHVKLIQHQDNVKSENVIIDVLKSESNKQKVDDSKIDTEVPDLLTIDKDLIEPSLEPEDNDLIDSNEGNDNDSSPFQAHNIQEEIIEEPIRNEEFPKAEVEWIQNGHDNEDMRLLADDDILVPSSAHMREAYSEHGRGVPLVQGRYAAILAGIFILLAVIGYAVMLSWRQYLENRYGTRHMLINEEDIYSSNDLKHFSL